MAPKNQTLQISRPYFAKKMYLCKKNFAMMRFCFQVLGWVGLLVGCAGTPVQAQSRRMGVAYYDLNGLYDTLPSPFGRDEAYQPAGRMAWGTERYRATLGRMASVIDSLAMPVVGLFGVENEAVALDLAAASAGDYAVVHATLNRFDGLDFALFYQADRFLPERVETGYDWMCVEGSYDDRAVVILLVRGSRFLNDKVEELLVERPECRLLVLGAMGRPPKRFGLLDPLSEAERRGRGTRRRRGGWQMADRVWLSPAWQVLRADVYARPFLFDQERGEPLPLYHAVEYRAGFSRNLPIFLYFRSADLEN